MLEVLPAERLTITTGCGMKQLPRAAVPGRADAAAEAAQKRRGMSGAAVESVPPKQRRRYSTAGETKPMRGPERREIGHGALAELALVRMLPTKEQFPYTIRIVSETAARATTMATSGAPLPRFRAHSKRRAVASTLLRTSERPTEPRAT